MEIDPLSVQFPRSGYGLYFRQLYRRYGWKAWVKQFRFAHRRPFSRGLIQKHAPRGFGIEVGVGFFSIAPIQRTVLTDGFAAHGADGSIATHFCKAHRIPSRDGVFAFVLSEHVLEHIANPVAALVEWHRVLKPGGKIFLFLPHPRRTFDRARERTSLQHLLQDDHDQVPEADSTHLAEWKSKVIDAGLAPHYQSIPIEDHPRLGIIHHHVWMPEDIVELLETLGWRVIESLDQCPDRGDTFVVVAEKVK